MKIFKSITLEDLDIELEEITLPLKTKIHLVFKSGKSFYIGTHLTKEEFVEFYKKSRRCIYLLVEGNGITMIRKKSLDYFHCFDYEEVCEPEDSEKEVDEFFN